MVPLLPLRETNLIKLAANFLPSVVLCTRQLHVALAPKRLNVCLLANPAPPLEALIDAEPQLQRQRRSHARNCVGRKRQADGLLTLA